VDDREEIGIEREDNPLADPVEAEYQMTRQIARLRPDRAHYERVADAKPFEWLPEHAWCQGVEIRRDIGKLGHGWARSFWLARPPRRA
jgi:hypothetical protein